MRQQYPPGEYLYGRFAQAQGITLDHVAVLSQSGDRATVAIDLVERTGSQRQVRRWLGTWEVVRTPGGWLLDRRNLQPAQRSIQRPAGNHAVQ